MVVCGSIITACAWMVQWQSGQVKLLAGEKNWKPLERKSCVGNFPLLPPQKNGRMCFLAPANKKRMSLVLRSTTRNLWIFDAHHPGASKILGEIFFYWGGTFILSLAARSARTKVIRCHMRIWVRSISDRFGFFLLSWRFLPSKKVLKTSISKN